LYMICIVLQFFYHSTSVWASNGVIVIERWWMQLRYITVVVE
jgi:hypothetical protein